MHIRYCLIRKKSNATNLRSSLWSGDLTRWRCHCNIPSSSPVGDLSCMLSHIHLHSVCHSHLLFNKGKNVPKHRILYWVNNQYQQSIEVWYSAPFFHFSIKTFSCKQRNSNVIVSVGEIQASVHVCEESHISKHKLFQILELSRFVNEGRINISPPALRRSQLNLHTPSQ